ncbi:LOW QUALITY PROTEIN: uncharacterized protein [Macaca fascicularis]|uniref:LOW QUALITY PROTEIN: uncharacterized protein n=1 Tax=Macaca fascicularis TaxID=9541 RepID=UPI003D15B2C1
MPAIALAGDCWVRSGRVRARGDAMRGGAGRAPPPSPRGPGAAESPGPRNDVSRLGGGQGGRHGAVPAPGPGYAAPRPPRSAPAESERPENGFRAPGRGDCTRPGGWAGRRPATDTSGRLGIGVGGRRNGHRGSPARPSGAGLRVLRGRSDVRGSADGQPALKGKAGASAPGSDPSSAAQRSLPARLQAPGGGARPGSGGVTRSSGCWDPGWPWGRNFREVTYPCVCAGPLGHWERNEVVVHILFSKICTRHQTEEAGAPESTEGRVGEEGGGGCSAGAGRPQPRGTRRRAKTSHPAWEGREGPREGARFQPGETRVPAASLSSRQRAPVLTPAPFPCSMLLTKRPGEECRSPRGQALTKHQSARKMK